MTSRRAETDEETPLLRTNSHGHHQRKHTPIPWAQFSILLVLRLADTLAGMVIYPFAPEVRSTTTFRTPVAYLSFVQLVRNIGITHGDETRVGYYVGLMVSQILLLAAFTPRTATTPRSSHTGIRR